jgi:hypothetical protein
VADNARTLLVAAGVVPEVMPENYTFNKVKEVLKKLEGSDSEELGQAIRIAKELKIRGPLATVIFVKHHLEGVHEVEVDRVDESEEGVRLAILVYPEGEVPVQVEHLPAGINAGSRLRYDPAEERFGY